METSEEKKLENPAEPDENQAAKSVIDRIKNRPVAPAPDSAKPPPK